MANFSCYSPLGPADLGPWLEIVKSALSLNSQVSVTGNFSGKSSFFGNEPGIEISDCLFFFSRFPCRHRPDSIKAASNRRNPDKNHPVY